MKKINIFIVCLSLLVLNSCLKTSSSGSYTCTGVTAATQKDTMISFLQKK